MKTEMEYPNLLLGDGTSMVVPTHSERSDLYTSTAAQQKQLHTSYHQIHAQAQLGCVDDCHQRAGHGALRFLSLQVIKHTPRK